MHSYLSISKSDGGLVRVSGVTFTSRTLREMFAGLGMQVSERSLIISRIDGDKLLTWECSLCIKQMVDGGKNNAGLIGALINKVRPKHEI